MQGVYSNSYFANKEISAQRDSKTCLSPLRKCQSQHLSDCKAYASLASGHCQGIEGWKLRSAASSFPLTYASGEQNLAWASAGSHCPGGLDLGFDVGTRRHWLHGAGDPPVASADRPRGTWHSPMKSSPWMPQPGGKRLWEGTGVWWGVTLTLNWTVHRSSFIWLFTVSWPFLPRLPAAAWQNHLESSVVVTVPASSSETFWSE